MNIGKKSVGISVGTKGARMSINSSGKNHIYWSARDWIVLC